MLGDPSDPAPTISVPKIIDKYRLDWGTYKQLNKRRAVAAQHLRVALYKHPLLEATGEVDNRFTVYALKGNPYDQSSYCLRCGSPTRSTTGTQP